MSEEILKYIKESVDRIENKVDGHADDISNIKQWQAAASGKATMLASMSAAIGGIIVWLTGLFHK